MKMRVRNKIFGLLLVFGLYLCCSCIRYSDAATTSAAIETETGVDTEDESKKESSIIEEMDNNDICSMLLCLLFVEALQVGGLLYLSIDKK